MSHYVAIWPIDNCWDTDTTDLIAEATPDLYDQLEAAGLAAIAEPDWARSHTTLFCRISVQHEHPAAGDARPWESRAAAADELFDQVAA